MESIRTYRLTSPANQTFFAALVPYNEGVAVASTRNGSWAPETIIHFADLIMPEQDLEDWDIDVVPAKEAPPLPGAIDFDKAFDPNQPRDEDGKWTDIGSRPGDLAHDDQGHLESSIAQAHSALAAASLSSPLTKGEEETIVNYTGDDYASINAALREMPHYRGPQDGPMSDEDIAERVQTLDEVFERVSLDKPVTVYRYVKPEVHAAFVVGGKFFDKGYVSTTMNPNMHEDWGNRIRIRMELPKGSKALPVAHLAHIATEREVLVARGQTYSVSKVGDEVVVSL